MTTWQSYGYRGQPGTCLWCGRKLRKQWDFCTDVGYQSNGKFCTLRCGFRFGVVMAHRWTLKPLKDWE